MSETAYSDLPRDAVAEFNPMIGPQPADTLHGVADILVMLADILAEKKRDTTVNGLCHVIDSARFAVRYEAARATGAATSHPHATEDWAGIMLDRQVENIRAKLILMLLAADADERGRANASPTLLARRAGMGEAQALTALRWLEKNKIIGLDDEPAFTAILHA